MKVYPDKKGRIEKFFAMLKGGGSQKVLMSFKYEALKL